MLLLVNEVMLGGNNSSNREDAFSVIAEKASYNVLEVMEKNFAEAKEANEYFPDDFQSFEDEDRISMLDKMVDGMSFREAKKRVGEEQIERVEIWKRKVKIAKVVFFLVPVIVYCCNGIWKGVKNVWESSYVLAWLTKTFFSRCPAIARKMNLVKNKSVQFIS